ncbi:hypothetical protein [Caldisericum sp.]|uniref:hypothetical protein n=1 Tax=Caldisericum sp. TaxID=2499687 RepID=UPI003D0F4DB8
MKILFKQKHWIVVQTIFFILAILMSIGFMKEVDKPVGGLAIGLHMIANTHEYAIPILFILFSDLIFNVEYVYGTFLSYLLCGQSRRRWMLKKSISFYIFILLQFSITFIAVSLVSGLILGHIGFEGLKSVDSELYQMSTINIIKAIGLNILKTFIFVSIAVFISTLFPHKLVIGSVTSIGLFFIMIKIMSILHEVNSNKKLFDLIARSFFLENPTKSAIILGVFWFLFFTWLSIERVSRIEIVNR